MESSNQEGEQATFDPLQNCPERRLTSNEESENLSSDRNLSGIVRSSLDLICPPPLSDEETIYRPSEVAVVWVESRNEDEDETEVGSLVRNGSDIEEDMEGMREDIEPDRASTQGGNSNRKKRGRRRKLRNGRDIEEEMEGAREDTEPDNEGGDSNRKKRGRRRKVRNGRDIEEEMEGAREDTEPDRTSTEGGGDSNPKKRGRRRKVVIFKRQRCLLERIYSL